MIHYVALLRGIGPLNPNMRNEKIRAVFEELGFHDVTTLLSSGNVLFRSAITDTAKLEAMIEEALPARLGFESTTIIRSHAQLRELADKDPFRGYAHDKDTYLTVTFLKHPSKNIALPTGEGYKVLGSYDRAICIATDRHYTKTPDIMSQLEKRYGKQITTRTWKTVERIVKRMR